MSAGRKRKRHFLFSRMMVSSVVPSSAVEAAAQGRKRGPSVLDRLRAEEQAAAEQAAAASARSRKRRKTTVEAASEMASTGGMSMKTGMVLARAKLGESASGIVVAQDRQAALVGKGAYRDAEKVARERKECDKEIFLYFARPMHVQQLQCLAPTHARIKPAREPATRLFQPTSTPPHPVPCLTSDPYQTCTHLHI